MQLIVTSPPYNIGKAYRSASSLDCLCSAQAQVISECVRLLHPRGSLCWQVGNHVQDGEIFPLDIVLYPVFREHGLRLRNRVVWHFEHGLHCSKRLSGRYETILWFTKADDYMFNLDPIRVPSKYPGKKYFKGPKVGQLSCNPLGKNPGDVWIFPNVKNNHVEKTKHPCQFPVELVERLVLALTLPGAAVFDPYTRRWLFGHCRDQAQSHRLRVRHRARVYRHRLEARARAAGRHASDATDEQAGL